MKKYSRVSYEQRCQISVLLQAKLSISEVATHLNLHKSTIYRELKRNSSNNQNYLPSYAQKVALKRYRASRSNYKIKGDLEALVSDFLDEGLSPEQISGRLNLEHGKTISHSAIYFYIYGRDNKKRRKPYRKDLAKKLRRHWKRGAGRYKQRRNKLGSQRSIHERPKIALERGRLGDWERDTMFTRNGIKVLVCIDRKSRFIKLMKLTRATSAEVDKLTIELLSETKKKWFTITNDNGTEFKKTKDCIIDSYFCDPLRPQQRGSVENVIGLIRQYISRKTNIEHWSKKDFIWIEERLNFRPRKILDYQTPHEVYFKEKVALVC